MKKMIKTLKISVVAALLIVAHGAVKAQVQYRLDPKSSTMVVKGTSTLHDWEMEVGKFSSVFVLSEGNTLSSLESGGLVVEVESIKSDHSLMDKKAYNALKKDSYPQINLKILTVEQNQGKGKAKIQLTIAGKTRTIDEDFEVKNPEEGTFEIRGSLPVRMSEYGMEPPVALMGTIKSGDDVQVEYNLIYHK